ncbi:MAG: hypothetical protein AAF602_32790, partial [Myxococcota bacterium]
ADAQVASEAPPEPDDPTADDPRYDRWVRIAKLYARDGEHEAALAALLEALSGDFLKPEAYRRALDSGVGTSPRSEAPEAAAKQGQGGESRPVDVGVDVVSALRAWWTHLHDVLGTTPPAPHARWVEGFDDEALEALHPGGIG